MVSLQILSLAALGACSISLSQAARAGSNWTIGQTVHTTSGPVIGRPAAYAPDVSEYLGVPFGVAPVGDLRWAAPVRFYGNKTLNGTVFGNTCYSLIDKNGHRTPNVTFANLTAVGESILFGRMPRSTLSEDCLNLNVRTKPQTGDAKKAVMIYIHGGGYSSGGITNPYEDGAIFADLEDVIQVDINYRLNIFGFPGTPNGPYNIGLMDQRLALEWLRDNIANFGGDPNRMTLFGTSAGASSTDIYSYAYPSDPIVNGIIPQSGTVSSFRSISNVTAATLWFGVANKVGCGNSSSNSNDVLSCMRSKDPVTILENMPAITGFSPVSSSFTSTIDEKIVFSNYANRTPAAVPLLIGSNDNEAGLFEVNQALNGVSYPPDFWDTFTMVGFTCPVGLRANWSLAAGNPTWRYRYFGAFPNTELSYQPYSGAWHGSQDNILFGNSALSGLNNTAAEVAIANWMRGAYATFAKDPVQGLLSYKGGWPNYSLEDGSMSLAHIGFNNETGIFGPGGAYDVNCAAASSLSSSYMASTSTATASRSATASPTTTSDAAPTSENDANLPRPHAITVLVAIALLVSTQ